MASRKEDKKERKQKKEKKPAAEGDGTTTLVVSIDDFTRTRDSQQQHARVLGAPQELLAPLASPRRLSVCLSVCPLTLHHQPLVLSSTTIITLSLFYSVHPIHILLRLPEYNALAMPARSHSRATTPGPGRGRTATPGLLAQDTAAAAASPAASPAAPLDLVQAIALLTYRINSTAQDLFLGAQQPGLFSAELTCEQVIVGLAALQSAVSDLSRAYINHANTVLNRGPSSIDIGGLNSLLENGLFPSSVTAGGGADVDGGVSAAEGAGRAASPGARSVAGTKRKRVHDPNAPKRALTAYFLYMKHERANIAAELGANARPKEVADEGTRRWGRMPPQEKQKWKDLYAQNLAVYNEEMSAYKASLPPGHKVDSTVPATPKPAKAAKTSKSSKPSTKEAARHQDDHDAAAEQQLQQAVREATTDDTSSESAGSSESEAEATPTPSPPKPTPKSSKRRQSKAAAAAAAAPAPAPAPPVIETPTPATKKSSPEKKEKKSKSKDKDRRASAANVAAVEVASPVPEPPKSEKKARKKRKSAVDE